jgi:DNA-directed RNA polymerase specialized sigma24 family protein
MSRNELREDALRQKQFWEHADVSALGALLARRGPRLLAFLTRLRGSEEEARRALLLVAGRLGEAGYEGDPAAFDAWLYRGAIEASRGVGRLREVESSDPVSSLPEAQREAFLLAHGAGLSLSAVALALRSSPEDAAELIEEAAVRLATRNSPAPAHS